MAYTVAQIQQLISNVVNQKSQEYNLNAQQQSNLLVAAEGDAFVESGFNPNAVAPSGNGGTVIGLYQIEVPNGMGAAYASNPNALLDPTLNSTMAINAMAQVAAQNPNFSPGQIAVTSENPYNKITQANQYNQYINEVNQAGNAIVSGNSPISTNTTFSSSGSIPNGLLPSSVAGNAQQSTLSGVKWYNPATWTLPVYNYLGQAVAILIGVVIIYQGFKITFGDKIGSIVIDPPNNSGDNKEGFFAKNASTAEEAAAA